MSSRKRELLKDIETIVKERKIDFTTEKNLNSAIQDISDLAPSLFSKAWLMKKLDIIENLAGDKTYTKKSLAKMLNDNGVSKSGAGPSKKESLRPVQRFANFDVKSGTKTYNDDDEGFETASENGSMSSAMKQAQAYHNNYKDTGDSTIQSVENNMLQEEVNELTNKQQETSEIKNYPITYDIGMNGTMIINEPIEVKHLKETQKIVQIDQQTPAGKAVKKQFDMEQLMNELAILREQLPLIKAAARQQVDAEKDEATRIKVKADGATQGQAMYLEYLKSVKTQHSI